MIHSSLLIISNGYGEDDIACRLALAFQRINPSFVIKTLPLVGQGLSYKQQGFSPLLENPLFPSGGFIRDLKSGIRDLRKGLFSTLHTQIQTIQSVSRNLRLTVCVGDVFCLGMGAFSYPADCFFMATAKSNRFMPHSWIERVMIKTIARKMYTRDEETAVALVQKGLSAVYLGNPMMEGLEPSGIPLDLPKGKKVIGILPGSREEAYANTRHILDIVEALYTKQPDSFAFVMAKAPSFDIRTLEVNLKGSRWSITADDTAIQSSAIPCSLLITPHFADMLDASTLIIGLAGTANEQAVFKGKRVYCFEGFGPQSSSRRFLEQRKLMGDPILFLPNRDPEVVAKTILEGFHKDHSRDAASTPLYGNGNLCPSEAIAADILKSITP